MFDEDVIGTTYSDTIVAADSTYYYAVTCFVQGVESELSNIVAVEIGGSDPLPLVENFTVSNMTDAGAGFITATVLAGFNKDVDYKLVHWAWNEAEPADTSAFDWAGSYVDTLDSEAILTAGTWPTADADSTVLVAWERGTPVPTTGFLLDVRIDNGAWAALGDTTGLGPTDTTYVHADTSTVSVQRGKLEYRAYAVSAGKLSPAAVTQQAVYNDATEMLFRLYIFDGTNYARSDIVWAIGVKYHADQGGGTKYDIQDD